LHCVLLFDEHAMSRAEWVRIDGRRYPRALKLSIWDGHGWNGLWPADGRFIQHVHIHSYGCVIYLRDESEIIRHYVVRLYIVVTRGSDGKSSCPQ
jgi:hypothetical protein